MKILAVNVNTTQSMTDGIVAAAQKVAAPDTEVTGLTPSFGAESVEGNFESYMAAVAVMNAVATYEGGFDAVIQAGFGEHGKEGLQEILEVPVVDITEAAVHMAMLVGQRFSVVTTLDRTVPLIEERLRSFGLDRKMARVRSTGLGVLELEDEQVTKNAVIAQAEAALKEERAEVIVLGCGGMAGLGEEISQRLGIPVVEGVAAAVKLAESLHALNLSTSKIRTFATPLKKKINGWPLNIETIGGDVIT